MARGGGGGGRGGGGRGGSRGRSGGYSRPMTKTEAMIFFPVLIFLLLFSAISETTGPEVYSETKLETFCEQQYNGIFRETESFEDNLLLTFLVYEDRSDFSYMTWVGDHINDATFEHLRGEGTYLDDILTRQVGTDYTYSLSADLSRAIRDLADDIDEATEYGSYTCTEAHGENPSGIRNLSAMELNEKLLRDSVAWFREVTGIPCVLVIEDAADVFG